MAKFILCVHQKTGMSGRRLLKSIGDRFADVERENYDDIEAFRRRMCSPACDKEKEIVIVFVDNNERLEQLITLKGCLEGRRLALILHRENREILSRCHLLRPRYVSCEKVHFGDLLSVLEKMINASGQCNSVGGKKTKGPKPH